MGEARDSSVLFSLNQLLGIEQERQREEEAQRAKKFADEEALRLATERSRREEEAQRVAAEEARRRADESRIREELARAEALRVGAVERARAEAEQKARMEALALTQEHERRLAGVVQDASKKRLERLLIGGALIAVVVIGGGAGLYFGKIAPENQQRLAEQSALLAKKEAERDALSRDLARESDRVKKAEEDLLKAKDQAALAKATRALDDAKTAEAQAKERRGGAAGSAKPPPKKAVCDCDPRDPACGCLP
jgi:colicin import membrane protein